MVPTGGNLGRSSGLVTDGSLGQNFGGQSGFLSLTLEQRGRFNPLTQIQVQAARLVSLFRIDSTVNARVAVHMADRFTLLASPDYNWHPGLSSPAQTKLTRQ